MKFVYAVWCSESESLPLLYSSKRKALYALQEEVELYKIIAKKRGEYKIRHNEDKTAFTVSTSDGTEMSVSIEKQLVH